GKLSWDSGRLTYSGEHARFSLRPSDVQVIQVVRGPYDWGRIHAVQIRSADSVFSLWLPSRGRSLHEADGLFERLAAWQTGELATPPIEGPVESPRLPDTRPAKTSFKRTLIYFGKTSAMLFGGAFLITSVLLGS